jgi:hypothetical protein
MSCKYFGTHRRSFCCDIAQPVTRKSTGPLAKQRATPFSHGGKVAGYGFVSNATVSHWPVLPPANAGFTRGARGPCASLEGEILICKPYAHSNCFLGEAVILYFRTTFVHQHCRYVTGGLMAQKLGVEKSVMHTPELPPARQTVSQCVSVGPWKILKITQYRNTIKIGLKRPWFTYTPAI